MDELKLGRFSIGRVVEYEGPMFAPDQLFPDASATALARDGDWLAPRFYEPDSNRLIMSFHSYVIRTRDQIIVVDTGGGNDKERPNAAIWHKRHGDYLDRMAALGVRPEDVDIVVCTHLHVDHVGWNTRLIDGRWVPTFPNARYLIPRDEFAHWSELAARSPGEVVNHGLIEDSVAPVVAAGLVEFVPGEYEIAPGIRLEPAPGHTPGQVMVVLTSDGETAIMTGDAIQHPIQISHPEWSSSFCTDPDLSRETRMGVIERAVDSGALVLTTHFADPVVARIARRKAGFALEF